MGFTRDKHVRVRATLSCGSFGSDDYRREVATCTIADGGDLGCALVRAPAVVRCCRMVALECAGSKRGSFILCGHRSAKLG
jgi:hypothetical protein